MGNNTEFLTPAFCLTWPCLLWSCQGLTGRWKMSFFSLYVSCSFFCSAFQINKSIKSLKQYKTTWISEFWYQNKYTFVPVSHKLLKLPSSVYVIVYLGNIAYIINWKPTLREHFGLGFDTNSIWFPKTVILMIYGFVDFTLLKFYSFASDNK